MVPTASDATGDNKVDQKKETHELVTVKDNTEFKSLLKGDGKVVVMFSASWAGTMEYLNRSIMPTFEKFPTCERFSGIKFGKIDVDEYPESESLKQLGIRAMPSFMFFVNGKKTGEVIGANPKALENEMEEFLRK
ncbi:thioredoxin domain-containing protein [Ditylenchus destructor]|nr:thioredoxin domain-containing protein [Ditylenchus destructor]